VAGPPGATAAAPSRRPPTSSGALRQVASDVGPPLRTVHAAGLAVAPVANPAVEAADLTPLAASGVPMAGPHLLPYTPSLAASVAKAATLPIGVVGLMDALVRVDRRAARVGGGGGAAAAAAPVDAAVAAGAGSAVGSVGLALLLWTVRLWYTRGRDTLSPEAATQPMALTVAGPNALGRNPMRAGVLLLLAGLAVAHQRPRVAAVAFAFFAIQHTFGVWKEEPALGRRHGCQYAGYMRRTPRWLPGLKATARAP